MHRTIAALSLCLFMGSGSVFGQGYAAVFAQEKGSRIDYLPKKGGFIQKGDAMSYRYEFIVPATGDTATIRLIPIGERTSVSEDYTAVIAQRSEDMIVLLVVYPGSQKPDKFETYTIYPRTGVAFSTVTSAYLGVARMKSLAGTNPDIPFASVSTYPLRRIDR